jgi:hypothetical protein
VADVDGEYVGDDDDGDEKCDGESYLETNVFRFISNLTK